LKVTGEGKWLMIMSRGGPYTSEVQSRGHMTFEIDRLWVLLTHLLTYLFTYTLTHLITYLFTYHMEQSPS
jgi:hypothetical protein